ncbi:DMT family transporter [Corynebacterium sp.]|uniref:DMT family transporter n=1 Tax=Corynebacterium sp. TaxID=1720 RepID=UPI00373689CA
MSYTDTTGTTAAAIKDEAGNAPKYEMTHGKAVAILLIGTACLAFSAIWVKGANFEPATSVVLRCWLPIVLFLPFAWREYKKKGGLNKAGIIWSAIAGLILGIDFTAWNYSIFFVGAGIASVLLNLQVIILPLLAFFIDRERIPRSYWLVLPVMAVGIVAVGGVFDMIMPGYEAAAGPAEVWGIPTAVLGTVAGLVSGICYGTYLYTSRKATVVNPGKYVQPIFIVTIFQGIAPIIWMLIRGEGFNLTQGVLIDGELPTVNPEAMAGDPIDAMNWVNMIMLAVLGQFIAWTFVQIGSSNMDATLSGGLLLLSPVSTIFIAAIIYGEIPTILQVLGVVLVLGAVGYQNGVHKLFIKGKDVKPAGLEKQHSDSYREGNFAEAGTAGTEARTTREE